MEKEMRTHRHRYRVTCDPAIMERYRYEDSAWHESAAAVEAGLAWGEEKARLLKWVRKQMRRRLTEKQRRCIELYYFKDLTYAQVGRKTGCNPSSAQRLVRRGIKRLRVAAEQDPPVPRRSRRRGRVPARDRRR